ncbi:MAG: radical SAM protein [Deltaproteobacteria bacterium]|nr:radical SAM protein [Deltaproteobacteria bacterium]
MAIATLIRGPSVVGRYALTLNGTPPISLAYLAGSLTAAGHEAQVIDAVGEALGAMHPGYRPDIVINGLTVAEIVARIRTDTDLVGISCLFSHEWPLIRQLIAAIAARFPGVPIVLGGEHATAVPELCLADAPALTACALGEGEETVVELLEACVGGGDLAQVAGIVCRTPAGPRRTAPRARIRDVDAIPLPRWDLTPIEPYLAGGFSFGVDRGRTMALLATRGCPYQCTFCSSPQMWTTRYTTRTPALVVDEIEDYVRRYGMQNVDFYDLTSVVQRDWILAFCRELDARGLRITWQLPSGTRSEALDEEVLRAMYRSGCRNVSYAPESGSERTLHAIKKKVKVDRITASMRAAVRVGLNVKANILIGFPDEQPHDVHETLRFLWRMARAGVHDVSVWTFSPYPGSELFAQLQAAGTLPRLDDDYYASLLSYSDISGAVSYAAALPAKRLQRYRVGGLLLFYAASYLTHPTRPLRSLYNIATRRYESRMEMSFANLVRRLSASRTPVEAG